MTLNCIDYVRPLKLKSYRCIFKARYVRVLYLITYLYIEIDD